MGFNRRKMEDERRRAAENEATEQRATDPQIMADAERLVAVWNDRQHGKCRCCRAKASPTKYGKNTSGECSSNKCLERTPAARNGPAELTLCQELRRKRGGRRGWSSLATQFGLTLRREFDGLGTPVHVQTESAQTGRARAGSLA
jgi:hypothetical protein